MSYMKDANGRRLDTITIESTPESFALRRLVDLTSSDRASSAGSARIKFDDAAQWVETWTDTSAWTKPATDPSQVSGGYLFGTTAPNPSGIARTMPGGGASLTLAETLTVTTNLVVPGGGVAGYQFTLGVLTDANAPASGGTNYVGFGVQGSAGSPVGIVLFNRGTFTSIDTTPLVAGTYKLTMTIDENTVSWSIVNAAHSIEQTATLARSTVPTYKVAVWLGDNRGTSGSKFGPIVAKKALSPVAPRNAVETIADSVVRTTVNSNPVRVALPANYDPRKPAPLCLFFHPYTGTEQTPWTETNPRGVINALTAAGFIVAAANGPIQNDWGNQGKLDADYALYQWIRDRYAIGPTVFYSESMGGLSGLLALAGRRIPCVGWVGSMPVCSLANAYAASYSAPIQAAYGLAADGSDYAAKTGGHDPLLLDGSAFRGVPMRFYASPADTSVAKAQHSDLLYAKVAGYSPASVVAVTGGHTDPSGFPATAIRDYLLSCVAL